MRIAYVIHSLDPGGTERLAVDIGRAMADDVPVAVFCLDAPGAWAPELRSAGIAVHGLWRQPGLDLSIPGRLAAHLRSFGATIVHAHQCTAWFYAALARWRHGAPRLVLHEHGRFFPEVDRPRRRIVNRWAVVPRTDAFVAVSADVADRLARYEGIPRGRIRVVYNGVRAAGPRLDRDAARARLGVPGEAFVIGTVGRLDPIKNLPRLVEAIGSARERGVPAHGVLIGEGPHRTAIERAIVASGLEAHVTLAGHRDDARALLEALDLFALPSLSEGTSMALLEAMAAGVPAVVTAVGGNPEVVDAGVSGWVVPSDDAHALAEAIVEAHAHPELAARRARAARERFEQRFSAEAMLQAWRGLYRELSGPSGALERRVA